MKLKTGILMMLVGVAMIAMIASSVSAEPLTKGLTLKDSSQKTASASYATAYATYRLYDAPKTANNDYYVLWMETTGYGKAGSCPFGVDGHIRSLQPKVKLLSSDETVSKWEPISTLQQGSCTTTTASLSTTAPSATISESYSVCPDKVKPYPSAQQFYTLWEGNSKDPIGTRSGMEFKTNKGAGTSFTRYLDLSSCCW